MTHLTRHTRIYDYRDPECPYDEDFTPEDEESLLEEEVDREIDERLTNTQGGNRLT